MIQVRAKRVFLCVVVVGLMLVSVAATGGVLAAQSAETPTPRPTRQPLPTRTPIPTPVPLAGNGIVTCLVSVPNLTESPDEYYISSEFGYGNPEGTLFIGLWADGKVIFHPGGAGEVGSDGSLSMKFWFYRTVPGEVVFEGVRLDEPGSEAAHLATLRGPADGYGEVGFHPAPLTFPSQGCWEVTASVGEDRMTFITLVVWLPFHPMWPMVIPTEGIEAKTTNLNGYPERIEYVVYYRSGKQLIIGTTQGAWEEAGSYSEAPLEDVSFNGAAASCVVGAWDGETWDAEADAGALFWSDADGTLSYYVTQVGLGLSCDELLQVGYLPEEAE